MASQEEYKKLILPYFTPNRYLRVADVCRLVCGEYPHSDYFKIYYAVLELRNEGIIHACGNTKNRTWTLKLPAADLNSQTILIQYKPVEYSINRSKLIFETEMTDPANLKVAEYELVKATLQIENMLQEIRNSKNYLGENEPRKLMKPGATIREKLTEIFNTVLKANPKANTEWILRDKLLEFLTSDEIDLYLKYNHLQSDCADYDMAQPSYKIKW